MTTINPLAAALAALFDQSLQAAVTSSRELDENEVRELAHHATAPTVDRLYGRIDSQAQTITELLARVTALEARLAALEAAPDLQRFDDELADLAGRVNILEAAPAGLQRFADGRPITAESIREIAEAAAEAALDEHCGSYDHDDYDALHNEWGSEEVSDFVKDGDIEDQIEEKVKEVLNNATFSVSI
jgi:hypothetical protein